MKQSVLNQKIPPACVYCAIGKLSCDGDTVLCTKKGVMQPDSHCRAFRYDPLKRVPREKPKMQQFTTDDFSLE